MAVYQATLQSVEASGDGSLHFDTFVTRRTGTSPNFVWVDVSNGHFTVVITPDQVNAIANDPNNTNNAKRRQALEALVKSIALAKGIDAADDAVISVNTWLTFPDPITIRSV